MFNPDKDIPKTVEDYITYITSWLSGDSGWSEDAVEQLMRKFAHTVRDEANKQNKTKQSDLPYIGWENDVS